MENEKELYVKLKKLSSTYFHYEHLVRRLLMKTYAESRQLLLTSPGHNEVYWRFYASAYNYAKRDFKQDPCILDLFDFTEDEVYEMLKNDNGSTTAASLAMEYMYAHKMLNVKTAKKLAETSILISSIQNSTSHTIEIKLFIALVQSLRKDINQIYHEVIRNFHDIDAETKNEKQLKKYLLAKDREVIVKNVSLDIQDHHPKFVLDYYSQNLQEFNTIAKSWSNEFSKLISLISKNDPNDVREFLVKYFTYLYQYQNYRNILKKYSIIKDSFTWRNREIWEQISDFYLDCPEKVQNTILVAEIGDI